MAKKKRIQSKSAKTSKKTAVAPSVSREVTQSSVTDAMQLVKLTVGFFVVNTVTVAAASQVLKDQVVLGTHMISPLMGLLQSMTVFTLLTIGAMPVIELISGMFKMKLQSMHWMAIYLVVNAAALWVTVRFAEMLGVGISSWMIVVLLAAIMDYLQGMVVKWAR
jgi:hypothetical protein